MVPAEGGGFAEWYARHRGGKAFFIGLVTLIVTWLALHWLAKFDPDLAGFEATFSIEASLALGFSSLLYERDRANDLKWRALHDEQTRQQLKNDERMLHMMEATRDNTAAIRDLLLKGEDETCGSGSGVSSSSPPSSD